MMDIIIQLDLYNYLDINSYLHLLLTTNYNYHNYNYDIIYKYYLEKLFSKNFIQNLKHIMISYHDSIKRIYSFNILCDCYNYPKWDENTYYKFWKYKYNYINDSSIE